MPTRDERRTEAAKHLALMKGAFAKETQATIDAAIVYEDGDALALELPEPTAEATETQVTTDFTTTALRRAQGKTAIVDPVSYTRPGGAYEDGSFGPEQILCSESNLYPVLCGMKSAYHDQNRSYMCGMLLTSRAMYLPNVVFVREGEIREANVIAVPEPNRERALENHRSERECLDCLAARIETMLNIAAANEIETLVVNAYACGRKASSPPRSSSFSSNGSPLTPASSKPSCSPCRAQVSIRSTRRSVNPRPLLRKSLHPPGNKTMTNSTSAQSIYPKASLFARSDAAKRTSHTNAQANKGNAGCIIRIRRFWLLGIHVAPNEQLGDGYAEVESLEKSGVQSAIRRFDQRSSVQTSPTRTGPAPATSRAFTQSAP